MFCTYCGSDDYNSVKGKYAMVESISDFSSANNKKKSKERCVTQLSDNEDNNNDGNTSCTHDS